MLRDGLSGRESAVETARFSQFAPEAAPELVFYGRAVEAEVTHLKNIQH